MNENQTKSDLVATPSQLFFSKHDSEDPRLGDVVKSVPFDSSQLKTDDFVLMGYPDDEGIKINGGRPGSADAPRTIRQFLYKMTPSVKTQKALRAFDVGDLLPTAVLAERHQKALQLMTDLHKRKLRTISFGGGHDYGYPDTAGFVRAFSSGKEKPLVINFDAHLDVRPTHLGFNSGTPFYRLLTEFGRQIDFVELGLQPQCNSTQHWNWATNQGAHLFDLQTLEEKGFENLWTHPVFSRLTKTTPVFVSFDIDAIIASEAGGCSQAWMTGLHVSECLRFLDQLYKKSNVRGLGIYEVSPPLDRDYQTSKTAALLAHRFLYGN